MLSAEARRVVRKVFDAVRARDLDLLLDLYDDSIVIEEDPLLPYGGSHRGRDGAIDHSIGFAQTWDRYQTENMRDPRERILDGGSTPVAIWTLRAAREGTSLGKTAATLFEVRAGKVTHLRMLHADPAGTVRFLAGC
jgi:ketosteroid isomerase-like protein